MEVFQKTISIDFDGCITSCDRFSKDNIPEPRKNAVSVINQWVTEGYVVIINTLRDDGLATGWGWENAARRYLDKYEISFHYFNANAPERIAKYYDSRKISADIYIDDRNLGGMFDDFADIDLIVKAQIGFPYKKINGRFVESGNSLTAEELAYRPDVSKSTTLFIDKFSPTFQKAINECPIANASYNLLFSGRATELEVIESLYKQLITALEVNKRYVNNKIIGLSPN